MLDLVKNNKERERERGWHAIHGTVIMVIIMHLFLQLVCTLIKHCALMKYLSFLNLLFLLSFFVTLFGICI